MAAPEGPLLNVDPTPLAPTADARKEADSLRRRDFYGHPTFDKPAEILTPEENAEKVQQAEVTRPKTLHRQILEAGSALEQAEVLIANKDHPEMGSFLASKGRLPMRNLPLNQLKGDVRDLPFEKLDLTGAICTGTDFTGANMCNAYMPGAQFGGASFGPKTDISRANFERANFNGAGMYGVTAVHTKMSGATFEGFTAKNSNFKHAGFNDAVMAQTTFDDCGLDHTRWNRLQGNGVNLSTSAGRGVEMHDTHINNSKLGINMDVSLSGEAINTDIKVANVSKVGASVINQSNTQEIVAGYTAAPAQQTQTAAYNARQQGSSLKDRLARYGLSNDAPTAGQA